MDLKLLFTLALGLLVNAFLVNASAQEQPVGYMVVDDVSYTVLRNGEYGSALYQIEVDAIGSGTAYLLDLHGPTRKLMGQQQGLLLGDKMVACYEALLNWMSGGSRAINAAVEAILEWQWDAALSLQTPVDFLDELEGITVGALSVGVMRDVGRLAAQGVVLANLPGDANDIKYVLLAEFPLALRRKLEEGLRAAGEVDTLEELVDAVRWPSTGCSNFGAWGGRTQDGKLFSGRNLDYVSDTGINDYKLVTIYHPPDAIAHSTLGFAGLVGALTGMSAAGVTVHEANLESDRDTFFGFPWTLRLRDVMERAHTLEEAQAVWNANNNTVGFNHAVGAANSSEAGAPLFVALETDAGHTAAFNDMDPRETANGGEPRPEALFRTNHGFDPQTIAHYQWNGTNADVDSHLRYALFPQIFDAVAPGAFGLAEAVRTAAVLGSKGDIVSGADFFVCDPEQYVDASNVLSAAFAPVPGAGVMYVAWEVGTGTAWLPACCSTYIKIDLAQWW